jgi:hypothetical protein
VQEHIQIHIYKSWRELPTSWDANLPLQHNLAIADLRVVEDCKMPGMQPLYVLATQGEQVLAVAYVQLLRFIPEFLSAESLGTVKRLAACAILGCWPMKLMVFGHLFRHDGDYIHFTAQAKDQLGIYRQLVDSVTALNRHNAVMFKDLPETLVDINKHVEHLVSFDNDVSMCLRIPAEWQSFDDYKAALKHKYTQRCNKTRKAFADVEIKELQAADIITNAERIFELYKQVTSKQNVTLGLLSQNYFAAFKEALGDKLHVQGLYYQGKMVAFSSAIVHNHVYDMNYIGLDYSYNQSLQLYFNLLFNCIQNAIAKRCSSLVLGRTALEAKAIVGCAPEAKYGYYKINNSILRKVADSISAQSIDAQGEQWKDRHPFKSEYYEAMPSVVSSTNT